MEAADNARPLPERRKIPWLVPVCIAGDVLVFLLFAAIGRASHGEAAGKALSTVGTALPFIAGWFVGALAWKAYGAEALQAYREGLTRVVPAWITGAIIALSIRSLLEHRIVPTSFAAIAFGFNLVLLLLWRTAVVAGGQWRKSD